MKKFIPILIVGVLICSGLEAVAFSEKNTCDSKEITTSLSFTSPSIIESGEFVTVRIEKTYRCFRVPGKPELPMVTSSFDLPFGSKNIQINCKPSNEQECIIQKKIVPSPEVVSMTNVIEKETTRSSLDNTVYESKELYPSSWFTTKITCGLNSKNERVYHITVYVFPVRYSPKLDTIRFIQDAVIRITYDPPQTPLTFNDEFDLVIITPEEFSADVQKLVDHKNAHNAPTFLKTTEDIYSEYLGTDKPEQIKYFIKDAIETNNIHYVLLVGGLKSYYNADDRDDCNQGTAEWHVPVRYTNIKKSGTVYDPGAISDLYFADIYKIVNNETVFEDWDSNDDGIFAHWGKFPGTGIDELDLNPDIHVGRLPCRNKFEVKIAVKKIIGYEQNGPDSKPWYTTMVGIGGLSHNPYGGQPDGEYLCDLAFQYMEDIIEEEVRIYASNNDTGGPIPIPRYIIRAFNQGAGYILFEGHGHPLRWDTHPVEGTSTWMGGLQIMNMWRFLNFKKLPFVVVGGCHNGQFNVTWYKTLHSEDYGDFYWTHNQPGSECFCWRMVTIPWGGAVATIGATGLTVSWSGQPVSLNGEIEMNIYYEIGQNGADTPGKALSGALQKFIDENTMELTETHCITIPHLFGDPSLQLGGIS
jgi:hypothetical protein